MKLVINIPAMASPQFVAILLAALASSVSGFAPGLRPAPHQTRIAMRPTEIAMLVPEEEAALAVDMSSAAAEAQRLIKEAEMARDKAEMAREELARAERAAEQVRKQATEASRIEAELKAKAAAKLAEKLAAEREAAAAQAAERERLAQEKALLAQDVTTDLVAAGVVTTEATLGLVGSLLAASAKVVGTGALAAVEAVGESGKEAVREKKAKAQELNKLVDEEKARRRLTSGEAVALAAGVTTAAAVEPVAMFATAAAAVASTEVVKAAVRRRLEKEATEAAVKAAEEAAAKAARAAEEAAKRKAAAKQQLEQQLERQRAFRREVTRAQMAKRGGDILEAALVSSIRVGGALIESAGLVGEALLGPEATAELTKKKDDATPSNGKRMARADASKKQTAARGWKSWLRR